MRQLRTGFVCLGTAVAMVAGMFFLVYGWLRPGTDSLLSPERLLWEQRRSQRLHDEMDAVDRIIQAKHALSQDVADGKLRLQEAARRFHELDAGHPGFNRDAFRRAYPGKSDEERYCREVIGFAAAAVGDEAGQGVALRGRLETELADYLRRAPIAPVSTAEGSIVRPISQ
jgi:hypothetical protein